MNNLTDAVLNLKAGDWVEVRNPSEILATLDENGRLENLPFMPEMFQFCGRTLRVFKRADKTCDNIVGWSIRRMTNSVHLEGLRCDGSAHGGCEAGCLTFWKEAWLKRAEPGSVSSTNRYPIEGVAFQSASARCTAENLTAASQKADSDGEIVYSCQATELRNYTSYMRWWDPRQYLRDVFSGNLASGLADDSRAHRALDIVLAMMRLLRALTITVFNRRQEKHRKPLYPFVAGTLAKTSVEKLDLEPGELVQVRTRDEILATLDSSNRNRGLLFDSEMLPYCSGIYKVLRRVHHIIDEKTGKMMDMKYPCIVLEGVVCQSDFHRLCPRAIYSYWREGWLKRVLPAPTVHADHVEVGTTRIQS